MDAATIIANATFSNLTDFMKEIEKKPFVWQGYIWRSLLTLDPEIEKHPEFARWAKLNKDELLRLPPTLDFSIPPSL
jgi:hypothetical protein